MTRRQFLRVAALAVPAAAGADARWIEPTNLRVTKLSLGTKTRFVHFTDFHFKGDGAFATEVVRTINQLKPEFVCFTGDLIERRQFAAEALDYIRQMRVPVFGAPGNHDYWSGAPFADYEKAFAATGGAWLVDRAVTLSPDLELHGLGANSWRFVIPPKSAERRLLLMHYPLQAEQFRRERFDLMLAGHSHGGQVRIPIYGAPIVPHGVGRYDHGFFETPAGPLYVNAGIGTYRLPIRLNCRPEITVITI